MHKLGNKRVWHVWGTTKVQGEETRKALMFSYKRLCISHMKNFVFLIGNGNLLIRIFESSSSSIKYEC